MRDITLGFEFGNAVQNGLRSTYCKYGHHGNTASRRNLLQSGAKLGIYILDRVASVAVGGLNQHRVSLGWRIWRVHQTVVWTA